MGDQTIGIYDDIYIYMGYTRGYSQKRGILVQDGAPSRQRPVA